MPFVGYSTTAPYERIGRFRLFGSGGLSASDLIAPQPTRKRMSRMTLPPKRCFNFRKMSIFDTCSSS